MLKCFPLQKKTIMKKILDIILTLLLLFLMAYQVTGERMHEWIGVGMTILIIVHHILNRKWYKALVKGRYNPYRILVTMVNFLLLGAFALTAFCGMSMSGYAVPFLYGMTSVTFARRFHLAVSHWAFVLTGLHLGLHLPVVLAKMKLSKALNRVLSAVFALAAAYGCYLFFRANILDYMLFRVPFAFLDYEKTKIIVIIENLFMLVFWAFPGALLAKLCFCFAKNKRN